MENPNMKLIFYVYILCPRKKLRQIMTRNNQILHHVVYTKRKCHEVLRYVSRFFFSFLNTHNNHMKQVRLLSVFLKWAKQCTQRSSDLVKVILFVSGRAGHQSKQSDCIQVLNSTGSSSLYEFGDLRRDR